MKAFERGLLCHWASLMIVSRRNRLSAHPSTGRNAFCLGSKGTELVKRELKILKDIIQVLVLVLVLGGQVLALVLVLGGQVLVNIPVQSTPLSRYLNGALGKYFITLHYTHSRSRRSLHACFHSLRGFI